jgi:hypothetical protein
VFLVAVLVASPFLATPAYAGPHGAGGAAQAPANAASSVVVGEVVETMNAAGYTYVQVDAKGEKVWAAGPPISVALGETVSFSREMGMQNFTSKALDRTFETIYFVSAIHTGDVTNKGSATGPANAAGSAAASTGKKAVPPAGPHAGLGRSGDDEKPDVSGIARADGGKTIGEIYDDADSLSGKAVAVRGKVVKANFKVMGKNWFHLRDGTAGADGKDDLTVTGQDEAAVGDVVVVRGTLQTDVDLGFGYHYDVILEEATITKE